MITVIGSINMDLLVQSDEIPKIGETLVGNRLLQIPGGKGANQGVSIAKLGGEITFLGKVGNDAFGSLLIESMKDAGVDVDLIEKENLETGVALINVDKDGNNNIVVIPGANNLVDVEYIRKNKEVIKKSDAIVLQLEIPLDTVKEALRIAKDFDKLTILNPAPAYDLDDEIIQNVDILIPNEHELGRLSKVEIVDEASLIEASNILLNKGIREIIVTLGSKGVFYINPDGYRLIDAYKVKAIDTTAAGDSFVGGFVKSYIEDRDIYKAIDRGQKTAALSVQRIGAQSSLPTREEVENFI